MLNSLAGHLRAPSVSEVSPIFGTHEGIIF